MPFNVYRADATLLLARGQVVQSDAQMEVLFERGTLVDLRELQTTLSDIAILPRVELPAIWRKTMDELGAVLQRPDPATFTDALEDAALPLQKLIARDPDLAIFQVLRQEGSTHSQYGLTHSVHTAIVTQLVAQRLGWSVEERERACKAALTMNISILALQGQLAEQPPPPSQDQRHQLSTHPQRSHDLLVLAGIADADWLRAVLEHHEERDGSGYPSGTHEPSDLAILLRKADVYTAKLSPRASREAQAADRVGRELFMQDPGHPVCAALVKEFGVYPPGCFVTLASGETGVVVARGSSVMTPLVAALTSGSGMPLPEPVRRDTRQPLHAILGVLPARQMHARLQPEKIAALME